MPFIYFLLDARPNSSGAVCALLADRAFIPGAYLPPP
jgi:hypothetical protein